MVFRLGEGVIDVEIVLTSGADIQVSGLGLMQVLNDAVVSDDYNSEYVRGLLFGHGVFRLGATVSAIAGFAAWIKVGVLGGPAMSEGNT